MYKKRTPAPPKVFDEKRLYEYGIWLLSRKDYSRHEIIQKMKKHQSEEEIISRVVEKLIQYGYINDERRANNILHSYGQKESSAKIKQRLIQKGIDKDIIEGILEENNDEQQEVENATQLLMRKFKQFDEEVKKKYISFLANKGYGWSVIGKAMDGFKNDGEQ